MRSRRHRQVLYLGFDLSASVRAYVALRLRSGRKRSRFCKQRHWYFRQFETIASGLVCGPPQPWLKTSHRCEPFPWCARQGAFTWRWKSSTRWQEEVLALGPVAAVETVAHACSHAAVTWIAGSVGAALGEQPARPVVERGREPHARCLSEILV